METPKDQTNWGALTPEEKKRALYLKQKDLLDTFLSHHAITQAQYDKSLGDLKVKMFIHNSPLKDAQDEV